MSDLAKGSISEMILHRGGSLSKQQTADLLICNGTQEDLSLSIYCYMSMISHDYA